MRLLLGTPLAALGLWAVAAGNTSPRHLALISHTAEVAGDGFTFFDLGRFYPPAPLLVSLVVASSAAALAVVSSFLAGSALHAAWERMMARHIPLSTQLALIASVTLIPSVWYLASQDIPTIGAMTMLVVALAAFIRFVSVGDTVSGFTAGLFLAAAFLFDPAALAYALALALATPLLASTRSYRAPGSLRALLSVLCFPILALLAGWAFLEWRFDGTAFSFLTGDLGLFQFDGSAWHQLATATTDTFRDVAFVPVYVAVGALLVASRPMSGLGFLIPIAGLVLVRWSGLTYSSTAALVLLTLLAMVSVPSGTSRLGRWIISAAAVVQLVLNLAVPPTGFGDWLSLI